MEGPVELNKPSGGSSKVVSRLFCPECGCQVTIEADFYLIAGGMLDDPAWIVPRIHF